MAKKFSKIKNKKNYFSNKKVPYNNYNVPLKQVSEYSQSMDLRPSQNNVSSEMQSKLKSKALPIYDPSSADQEQRIPIDTTHTRLYFFNN